MTVTRNEIDGMKQVLLSLNAITESSPKQPTDRSVPVARTSTKDPDSDAMLNILTKLAQVSDRAKTVVLEGDHSHNRQLATTTTTGTGVQIAGYRVDILKTLVGPKEKNTYGISEVATGKVLYTDLSLYESVMQITKKLLQRSSSAMIDCDKIAEFDADYARNLHEAKTYKQRISTASDPDRRTLYENKYSRTIGLAKEARRSILKM